MRRADRYTVPEKLFAAPEPTVYRDAFRELPFLQRLYLLLRRWLGGADIAVVIKEHELDDIRRSITERDASLVDPSIPALLDGFYSRVRPVAEQIAALRPVLADVRGAPAGVFLRDLLQRLEPELYQMIEATALLPEELLNTPTMTVAAAKKDVHAALFQSLEINRKAIKELLDPVWNSLEALAYLSTVDFTGLVPTEAKKGIRIPMRVVRDPLVQFSCAIELCTRNRRPDVTRAAAEFVAARLQKRFPAHETIWNAIDTVVTALPLEDLVRLASDEPRLTLVRVTTPLAWWARFSAAWLERVDVQGPLLRHRLIVVEEVLRNGFAVTESATAWIPPSLFQRSAGSIRRLGGAQRFRDTRTMVGTLAREQNIIPPGDRAAILEAHVELDKAYAKLEELTGFGESRGSIGEELRRLNQSGTEGAMLGMHKMNLYSKHRPEMRVIVQQAIEALSTIAKQFDRSKAVIRKALSAGTVRLDLGTDDLPPVEFLELLTDGYRRLSQGLQGLFTLEQELTEGSSPEQADTPRLPEDVEEAEDAEEL